MCSGKSAGASRCRGSCPRLASIVFLFAEKELARSPNICLIIVSLAPAWSAEEICYSVSQNRSLGPHVAASMADPGNRNGYCAPAETRNRDHEILTSLRLAPLSPLARVPRSTNARVCSHRQCSRAIWALRARSSSERADPRLDSISRVSSVTQRVFVVSQFCMRLAAPRPPSRRRERDQRSNFGVVRPSSNVREREGREERRRKRRDARVNKFVPRSSLRRDLSDLLVGHDSIEHRKRRPLHLSLSLAVSVPTFASAFRGGPVQTAQTGIKYT